MVNPISVQLSKTRFVGGLQCFKRLHLECYQRDLMDPIDPGLQAIFDTGNGVGELARNRFPRGRLIEEPYFEHTQAVTKTTQLLTDYSIPAFYEAAFEFAKIRVRVDVLQRHDEVTFNLIEVKSGTSVKSEHIPDVAIQLYVLESLGLTINQVYLMHIDNTYIYQGGDYNLEELFSLEDITEKARDFALAIIPEKLDEMWQILDQDFPPSIEIGSHCTSPYKCPFYGHCHQDLPDHPIRELPRSSKKLRDSLKASGIEDIRKIPKDYPGLNDLQKRVISCVETDALYISPEAPEIIAGILYPLSFIDFETFNPALPIYHLTRPFQPIPFQWSLHIQYLSGQLEHQDFLYENSEDPRLRFVESLLDAIPDVGTIIAYSGYEESTIKQLATVFPEFENELLALSGRIFDLLKLIRDHYYHPEFHGSFSIKSVLPAIVPNMGYSDLAIQHGLIAAIDFGKLISPATPAPVKDKTKQALLEYCQRDTEAMVRIFENLTTNSLPNITRT